MILPSSWASYSTNLERFILVDEDVWPLLHTSRLLSSKFSLCVCAIESDEKILNPLDFTLENPANAKQDQQVPLLITQSQKIKLNKSNLEIPIDVLDKQVEYAKLSLKIVKAAWIADSMYNDSDHRFYLDLMNETEIESKKDSAGLEDRFLKLIDRAIYLSTDISELVKELEIIFDTRNSIRPTNLRIYKSTFYEILESFDE